MTVRSPIHRFPLRHLGHATEGTSQLLHHHAFTLPAQFLCLGRLPVELPATRVAVDVATHAPPLFPVGSDLVAAPVASSECLCHVTTIPLSVSPLPAHSHRTRALY